MLENKLFEIYRRETCSFYLDVALASSKYKCMFREAKKGFKYSHQPQTRASTRKLFYKNKLSAFENLKSCLQWVFQSNFSPSIRIT